MTQTDPAQVEQDEILSGPKAAEARHDAEFAAAPPVEVSARAHSEDAGSPPTVTDEDPGSMADSLATETPDEDSDDADDRDNDADSDDDQDEDYDAAYEAHLAAPNEPARAVFADLGLSAEVLRAIDDMGYRHPTPIQEQAIPIVLMTRDVLGVAQTGTGKTASFTLPMLDILAGSRARARMPRSLILEPTRELALQVAENFVQYGKYLKLTHALIIGGESMSDQREVLNKGVDVLIATPGRLIDMFDRGTMLLTDTRILVIDEADRMLDMGFIPDVERIVSLLPKTRQTLFFSATMGPEIKRLADAFLQNPKEITVSRSATVAIGITEGLALVAEHDKREALRRLIRTQNVQNALIFCNRKSEVDILHKSLIRHKFDAGALHGDMAQTVRFTTLEKFKAGELRLLVCSDVAARGLDIGGLSHVFNFDVPHHAEDYVHRIGRTGRAGLEGHAFTIAMPEDRMAVEAIEKLTGHAIPPMIVEGLDPVDWAEFDGRKRRGRKAPAKKAPAGKAAARGKRAEPAGDRAPRVREAARPRHEAAPAMDDAVQAAIEDAPSLSAHDDSPRPHARVAPEEMKRPAGTERSSGGRGGERAARPGTAGGKARSREPAPRMRPPSDEPRQEARRDEPRREDARRDEPRRDDARRDEPRRDAPVPRDRPAAREERPDRWRQNDLGPSVVGFGDDVPAFMMVRRRPMGEPMPEPLPETDA